MLSHLLQRWHSVSLVSVIDILLVALLIYQFLVLVKGTRAAQILLGVGVLALAFYIARLGELTTVNWLVTTLLPYAIFALIVVFQNEIRHALAKVGRRLSFARGAQPMGSEAYDDVVLAANLFSQNQTGALMVIEREIGLRTYIESGVPLDAHISYDLLATIFRPSAPLHDGAAIIQKERVAAAACFLPLSMNPVLSTQLGTRHRAGIGITEETDAIAVIVSEESGAISRLTNCACGWPACCTNACRPPIYPGKCLPSSNWKLNRNTRREAAAAVKPAPLWWTYREVRSRRMCPSHHARCRRPLPARLLPGR